MIPGNVDPRRPDKVQRYKPPAAGNGGSPGDDLTPDYMNILGPESTTGNALGDNAASNEAVGSSETQKTSNPIADDGARAAKSDATATSKAQGTSNVIPTSPQYGVAIITESDTGTVPATDTVSETIAKTMDGDAKDIHSTPSKNDRFKVVKIASSEPFKRGRWKCMDYVDQAPPVVPQQTKAATQGGTVVAGTVYMPQSLPPQQIQQLLMQSGGYTTTTPQYFQQQQSQMVPQTQYFYTQGGVQPQTMPQPIINPVAPNSVQPAFINTNQHQYFQAAVIPNSALQNFHNVQFVQPYQNQGSAFVPTTQTLPTSVPANFQPGQSYPGQPTTTQGQTQSQPATQTQPMVNGFAYSQNVNEPQIPPSNLPTQVAKNVILNTATIPPVLQQPQVPIQNQESQSAPQTVPIQNQIPEFQQVPQVVTSVAQVVSVIPNPSITEGGDPQPQPQATDGSTSEPQNATGETSENPDDPAKTNPVVNAIDNKIEQAMDLVKSHLMYTVREEVEVLKEKIAELMERIQQLESENNFLRTQIPKNAMTNANGNNPDQPAPPHQ